MTQLKDFYEDYWEHRKEINHLYTDKVPGRIQDAICIIDDHNPNRVLDAACGEGTLGRMLGDRCEKIGIDISEEAVKMASHNYNETVQMDLENEEISKAVKGKFDAVVSLEVLEHVFRPDDVLENLRNVMTEDGVLISSFPNFVHWKYRFDMVRGQTPQDYTLYSESEHIQDFTMAAFEKLLRNAGFEVIQWHPQYSMPRLLPSAVGRFSPSLFANQIVVESAKV